MRTLSIIEKCKFTHTHKIVFLFLFGLVWHNIHKGCIDTVIKEGNRTRKIRKTTKHSLDCFGCDLLEHLDQDHNKQKRTRILQASKQTRIKKGKQEYCFVLTKCLRNKREKKSREFSVEYTAQLNRVRYKTKRT